MRVGARDANETLRTSIRLCVRGRYRYTLPKSYRMCEGVRIRRGWMEGMLGLQQRGMTGRNRLDEG